MKRSNKLLIIGAILLMVVGFAAVATTLTINGVASVTNNSEDYEIYFSEAVIDNVSTPSAISANRKTITFNTKVLTDVNQTSTLVYEVTNNSKNYDAEVEIECEDIETGTKYNTGVTNTAYFSFNTTNTPEVIRARTKENGSIVVTLTHLSTEIRSYGYRCTMTVNAVERGSLGVDSITYPTLVSVMHEKAEEDTTFMMYDGTEDNNLRYVGPQPSNYVYFNDELWRIIGDFDGNVKIRRNEYIGEYTWDKTESNVNLGTGINDWTNADLANELNGDYLNSNLQENPIWVDLYDNNKTFDKTKALSVEAQSLIVDGTWYLGAPNDTKIGSTDVYALEAYENEHSNNPHAVNQGKYCEYSEAYYCDDTVQRNYTTTKKVGLISVSDYLFSFGNLYEGANYTTISLNNIGTYTNLSWMYNQYGHWTISPYASTSEAGKVFYLVSSGDKRDYAYSTRYVYPVVFLNSNVVVKDGDGSIDTPYVIDLN